MTAGIVAWGTYLPYWRLRRAAIAQVLGAGPGRGTRAVASYDEDTTTLGVEAGRRALAGAAAPAPQDLLFSTPGPRLPGQDQRHHACTPPSAWPAAAAAYDFCGSSRSALGALALAPPGRRPRSPRWPSLSDLRSGLAGGAEERDRRRRRGGLLCAARGRRGRADRPGRFERRVPRPLARARGDDSHVWEERFGEEMYVPLAREAFADALKDAGITESDIDHAVVVGLHVRAVKAVRGRLGAPEGVMAPDLIGRGRQPRRGPRRRGPGRCARAGRAGTGHRRPLPGRRRRRPGAAHHRCPPAAQAAARQPASPPWPSSWPAGGPTSPTPRS